MDASNDWEHCRDLWLAAIQRRSGSLRSRTEYARVWQAFNVTSHRAGWQWWDVTTTHAQQWAVELAGRLAPASVNKCLSVLSSLYRFAGSYQVAGRALWPHANPFADAHLRARVARFGRSQFPSTAQVVALLGVMDTSSATGLRDLALYGGMFATTRRLSEWLNLRWGDITAATFTCRIKGGRIVRQMLPAAQYNAIVACLQAAGNWPPAPTDYLFCSLAPVRWDRPLNAGYVAHRLRHYGALAGVPAALCHPHGLRHAGARWRRQHGATAWELQTLLGHANIGTTEIYCREVLDYPTDRLAGDINAFFADLHAARMQSSRGPHPDTAISIHPFPVPAPLEVRR